MLYEMIIMSSTSQLYCQTKMNLKKVICCKPMYYTYKVVETKYKERYNEALGGMERYVVETKTCYVDVFSHWDFTHVAK